jgi:FHA domain
METGSNWDIPCWSSGIGETAQGELARVMNPSPLSPARLAPVQRGGWLVEVVRGRDVGRTFALEPGETVVGNALNGQTGLDLREQEGSSPRRMAARHASLICLGTEISIRDLESPGGTFVNQQRLLSGQPRKLCAGDVIQLGGVQLKVKEGRPTGVSDLRGASSGRLPTPFAMANGAQCRAWDDFLILSAQSWLQVRDELTSGRLAEYLRRIGRLELVPESARDRSADDRLDEWLGRIPAAQSSAPELDVHPEALVVQAKMGGGVAKLSLRITNVGFRLLRSSLHVEPAEARWVRLLACGDGKAFETIDQTEIPVELELPETIDRPVRALIVIESNGGARRVEVRIERPAEPLPDARPSAGSAVLEVPLLAKKLRERLAHVSPFVRAAVCGGGAAGVRLVLALFSAVPLGRAAGSFAEPRIASVALLAVGVGVLSGVILAKRRGEPRDGFTAGFAGGLLGLLASAPVFSLLESVEHILGSWSTSVAAVCLLWGATGTVAALLSTFLIPHRQADRQESP